MQYFYYAFSLVAGTANRRSNEVRCGRKEFAKKWVASAWEFQCTCARVSFIQNGKLLSSGLSSMAFPVPLLVSKTGTPILRKTEIHWLRLTLSSAKQ
jgi:hypothetical protein